jgi:hypothetical protein
MALAASAGIDDELVAAFFRGLDEMYERVTGATLPDTYKLAVYQGFLLALIALQEQLEG